MTDVKGFYRKSEQSRKRVWNRKRKKDYIWRKSTPRHVRPPIKQEHPCVIVETMPEVSAAIFGS